MATWHNENPIMTTNTAVAMDDLVAHLTGNRPGNTLCRDLRIDSTGRMFTRPAAGAGVVNHSDTRRHFDLDCGLPSEYSRNFFGAIVRG